LRGWKKKCTPVEVKAAGCGRKSFEKVDGFGEKSLEKVVYLVKKSFEKVDGL